MTIKPLPGQWAVVSHGPGERAILAQVVEPKGASPGVYLDRSPYRVLPANIALCLDSKEAAQAFAEGVDRANGRYNAAMERSRTTHADEWKRTVARAMPGGLEPAPAERAPGDVQPGDVHPESGAILSNDRRWIPSGRVLVSYDQAKAAKAYGWVPISAPTARGLTQIERTV